MSAGGSPPKPWERAAAGGSAAMPTSALATTGATTATAATPSISNPPTLPARSDALNAVASRTASAYTSPYNRTSPYGMGAMGGMGGMSSYSSPYSRFGGGMYGGGMGGYGGYGMGGYGMGGYGGMYGGGPGMYGANGQEASLTQTFSDSTQATFQMIESIVGAFGGFAQMLESTYMATHSSFFAMVSVAEQFGNLRQTLGSVLGIFALMRWTRTALAKLTGRPLPADARDLTPANFAAFSGRPTPDGSSGGAPATPRPSRKPFVIFMLAIVGLPYLMGKLIRAMAAHSAANAEQQAAAAGHLDASQPLDPSKLDFCRVLYDYTPALAPGQTAPTEGLDLAVVKGDLVAVLSKLDPSGQPSEWWRCRARDGRMGYLPAPYLETIQRRPAPAQIAGAPATKSAPASAGNSRVNTMTTTTAFGDRAESMKITDREKKAVQSAKEAPVPVSVPVKGKGEVSVEAFQRGGYYS